MNASGENSRPSCASSVNTGTNDSVITMSEKKRAGPTSTEASLTSVQRSAALGGLPCCASNASMCLCAFSTMTIAASTMAPIAMAMPPSDMMLALTPCQRMTTNAARTPIGKATTATSAERRWNRKTAQTSATTMNSSMSFVRRLSTARSISSERS